MELKVICKRLITTDLDGSVTEGEYGADIVGITVPRFYGDHDLSAFSFRITAVSSADESVAEQVLTMDKTAESSIHLLWNITSDFTVSSGKVTLILAGVKPDNTAQIKFISEPVTINDDSRLEFIESPTLIEQAYNQVQLEVQKAIEAADRAEKAASAPVAAEIFPATEEKLGGVKSGNDISVADDGTVTVNSVSGKKLEADVPENAVFTDTVYDDTEIRSLLAEKADKEEGKGLSSNDLTDELKADYDSAVSAKHSHENKAVLDGISADKISLWDSMTEGGGTIGEATSYTITDSVNYPVMELHLYGKSVQNGTPTPENPVDIVSVGDSGTVEITACGKNLVNPTEITTGGFNYDTGTELNNSARARTGYIAVTPAYLVGSVPNGYSIISIYHYTATKEYLGVGGVSLLKGQNGFIRLLFKRNDGAAITDDDLNTLKSTLIVTNGESVEYEPYKANTASITTALPLCSVGDVCDELIYNADGTGKVVKYTEKIDSYNGEAITTPYMSTTGEQTEGSMVIYQLVEPQEIELSAAEITALKNLYTYDSVTNIYNNANACMSIKYCNNRMLSEYVLPLIKSINN